MSEEYQTYLCSREWGLRREAVIERSGGVCERKHRGTAVHHLTYARIYNEPLTDLVHLCDGCHDYQHGRSDDDPAEIWVYMAGAVVEDDVVDDGGVPWVVDWRSKIFTLSWSDSGNAGAQRRGAAKSARFLYGGPDIDGCHGMASEEADRHLVTHCLEQVRDSDVLFAWIDRTNTVGTIVEIATASSRGISIFVAFENEELARYFYFIKPLAGHSIVAPSADAAWQSFTAWFETVEQPTPLEYCEP